MMDRRKELTRQYKETSRPAGVFRVRNEAARKSFLGTSTDLPSMVNRQRFQLRHGSHANRELQKAWNEAGEDAFTIEILDALEPRAEPGWDPADDLPVLLAMWIEKLAANGETFYGDPRSKG